MDYQDYTPSGLSLTIFQKRYAIHDTETFGEACDRVAYHVSQAEHGEAIARVRADFQWALKKNLFFPGGRIMYGSGRPKGQLLNCFVIPTSDSREGWGKSVSDMIVISGTGGGLGMNGSPVRPRGSTINGSGGVATGSVSLMSIMNAAGSVIKAGGGRRTALMFALNHTHGDIVEFLDAKLDKNELTNANVSINFDENPEIFFKAVKDDADWDLKFRGKTVATTKAREIWHKIVRNALKGGEPGMLNGYLANRMSNIHYIALLVCTNPCGEIWLSSYDTCCLGSVVLPRFVDAKERKIDWETLKRVVAIGVRFLDNVLTVNNYPLPEIKDVSASLRRVGLGVTGLHDMLLLLGLKYNSAAGLEMVDKVMSVIKNAAYEASIELAKEKGAFPRFDAEQHLKSGFIKTLKPSLREKIRENGIRNAAILTIAPVGTGSMVCGISNEICGVSSGIEPMFAAVYERKYRDGDKLAKETVVHPLFKWMMDQNLSVKHFQGAHELRVKDHLEMQRVCQRHLDNACSKTINLPHGTKESELSELYMEYFPELKGVTVYPEGSREDQPLTPVDLDKAVKIYEKAKIEATEGKCHSGVCEL